MTNLVVAAEPAAERRAPLRAATLPHLDQAQQDHPGGVPVFEPAVGDRLLVPATLGGIAWQSAEPQGRVGQRRTDSRSGAWNDGSAFAGAASTWKGRTIRCSPSGPSTSSARKAKSRRRKPGFESFDYLAGQTLAKLIDAERRSTAAALAGEQPAELHVHPGSSRRRTHRCVSPDDGIPDRVHGRTARHRRVRPGRCGTRQEVHLRPDGSHRLRGVPRTRQIAAFGMELRRGPETCG